MKVTIEKDASGRELASCENVNSDRQYLRDDYVFIRACDGAVLIGLVVWELSRRVLHEVRRR